MTVSTLPSSSTRYGAAKLTADFSTFFDSEPLVEVLSIYPPKIYSKFGPELTFLDPTFTLFFLHFLYTFPSNKNRVSVTRKTPGPVKIGRIFFVEFRRDIVPKHILGVSGPSHQISRSNFHSNPHFWT